uniref:Putative secreted protein n=1 Tax=Ixodes ricinus TaxID=34613 RepID=A0A6B0UA86_IXORI
MTVSCFLLILPLWTPLSSGCRRVECHVMKAATPIDTKNVPQVHFHPPWGLVRSSAAIPRRQKPPGRSCSWRLRGSGPLRPLRPHFRPFPGGCEDPPVPSVQVSSSVSQ